MQKETGRARGGWAPILGVLGAAALARAAMGLQAYPYGDDFVFAPLARLAADPSLYPGDAQLHSFGNHSWAYSWIWRAAEATVGPAPVFLALTLATCAAIALGLLAIMRALGASGLLAGPALWLAVLVTTAGVGRATYAGAFSDHFHVQGVAVAFCLFAIAAALRGLGLWAGLWLGAASLAHPVVAFHAALIVGCAFLAEGRRGLAPLASAAALSALIAAPAYGPLLLSISTEAAPAPAAEIIRDGYLFRAAHHYRIDAPQVLALCAYLALGLCAAAVLARSRALGAMLGAAILGCLTLFFHAEGFDGPLREAHTGLYILDLTRSSPILWLLAAAFAFAAVEIQGGGRGGPLLLAGAAAIAIFNFDRTIWAAMLAVGALYWLLRPARAAALAPAIGAAALTVALANMTFPNPPRAHEAALTAWIRAETAPSDMLIAPPLVANLREETLRPVYVDFRAVSKAQPAHVWLTRKRFEEITPGFEDLPEIGGWEGARLWTLQYATANTPERIAAHLARTGARFFVTYSRAEHSAEDVAAAGLEAAYRDELFVIYRKADE